MGILTRFKDIMSANVKNILLITKQRQRAHSVQEMKAMQEHFWKQRRRKRKNWLRYRKLMI